jgi:hypothetical protein
MQCGLRLSSSYAMSVTVSVPYMLVLANLYFDRQDDLTGKLRMTHDAHILAQIYLAELRIMAARHTYTHDGSLEDPAVSYSR